MAESPRFDDAAAVGVAAEEARLRRRVAKNVRARRAAHGLSREAAAAKASMDVRHWAKVEAGEHAVTLRTLAKLSIALGVDARDLLDAG